MSSAWFVILNVSWFLSTTRRFSPEAVERYSSLFHLFAWGSSALWMVITMLVGQIRADDLTGICSLEYGSFMYMFADLLLDTVSLVLFLIGLISMIKIKLRIETPKFIQLSRLKLMVRRVTLFVLVYLASKGTKTAYNIVRFVQPNCSALGDDFYLHMAAESSTLFTGFMAGFWIWNTKTFKQMGCLRYKQYSPKMVQRYQHHSRAETAYVV